MKILMFGRGAIATIYGWALKKTGHDVEFYVRPGRATQLGRNLSVNIIDERYKSQQMNEEWQITLREDISRDQDYDLIIVSVQHYKFKEAAEFLAEKAGKATILIFNNFWNDPEQEAAALPHEQLVWGFPKAGGSFDANGKLEAALFKQVHFGTFGADTNQRGLTVRKLFEDAEFEITEHRDFKGWLWIHFAVVTGFNTLALTSGTVGNVMAAKAASKKAILVIRELLDVVAARGIQLSNNKADFFLYKLPLWLAGFLLPVLTKFNKTFRTAFAGQINTGEAKSACRDVLQTAAQLSVPVPLLKAVQPYFK